MNLLLILQLDKIECSFYYKSTICKNALLLTKHGLIVMSNQSLYTTVRCKEESPKFSGPVKALTKLAFFPMSFVRLFFKNFPIRIFFKSLSSILGSTNINRCFSS